ncbi:MAG TPA: Yip1 family protein [Candidatus Omnitrophota bacterium]|nr:YIP1 family protein [Candidatus Omnitrophota bacterium]HQO59034.1 Yip1 family protein [Candidatus Omnitrophota bacterium]
MQNATDRYGQDKTPVPWDIRDRVGLFPALGKTVLMVLFHPDEFFRDVQVSESVSSPRNFFILVQCINFCVMGLIHFYFHPATPLSLYFFVLLFFAPIIMLGLLLLSAVMHIFVKLAGGKRKFTATFHVLAYSSVTGLLQGLPWVGKLASLIWGIYVGIIGLRRVQGLSVPRAVTVCVMPSVLALILIFAATWAPKHYRVRDIDKNDRVMQMTLKRISSELETYAQQHDGHYPAGPDQLKAGLPSWAERYCGVNQGGFLVSCQFDQDGYVLTATPVIIEKTGTTTFTVQTGGVRNFGD